MKDSLDYMYRIQKELSVFGGIGALLGWDQMTYMPPLGAAERSEQISLISRLAHERSTSEKLWKNLELLYNPENIEKLKEEDRIVVQRMYKDIEKARKVPSDFVERASKTTTIAFSAWEEARKKNSFKVFQPHLEKIIELEKEYCGYINLPGPLYNNLLDNYEEGMTVDRLKNEFKVLKSELKDILNKIKNSDVFKNQKIFDKKLDVEKQKNICKKVINKMGLTSDKSRLDISTHPFTTTLGNDDVRITTSYERDNPFFAFFSTVHEAGHALYEMNLPRGKYKDTVISDSPSLGLHESQSRFWENMIARGRPFWDYFYPVFQSIFKAELKNISLDEWYRIMNQVSPSLIRVEADELTYCLHVILRFEIETGLMDDKINVAELPVIWNEKMDEYLGVRPDNDNEGVLQDMHWSGGSVGYFPTYAIGTIYSSQLFETLIKQRPSAITEIKNGNFSHIIKWLNGNIHCYGRSMTADEIIKNTCGEGLNSKIFVEYLKDKYLSLYEC